MKKQECPVCGKYAILLKDQKVCWDCYIKRKARRWLRKEKENENRR